MAKIVTKYIVVRYLKLQLTNVYFIGNQRGIFQENKRVILCKLESVF